MREVVIYVEGGGNTAHEKTRLRQGFEVFLQPLKERAREKRMGWKLVCCGGREQTFRVFRRAVGEDRQRIVVLLVDAEGPVNETARVHLKRRDGWHIRSVNENLIHLMVQVMETWIVADPEVVANYYGKGFLKRALPRATDLERVAKAQIQRGLTRASKPTQKGAYKKILHGGELLMRIDPEKVTSRCPHCARLFSILSKLIQEA